MPLVRVCDAESLAVGDKQCFKLEGQTLLLFHLSDGYYATQARCTHLFKSMANGEVLEDRAIRCPLHRAEFNIRSGEVEQWANFPPGIQLMNALRSEKQLETYPVTLKDGAVFVELNG